MKRTIYVIIVLVLHMLTSSAQTVLWEDFNSALPTNWTIDTTGGANWIYNPDYGSGCAFVVETDNTGVDSGSLETVAIDLTQISNPVLSFKVATVQKNFIAPQLQLHYTTGSGWKQLCIWSVFGTDSTIAASIDFTPPLDSENIIWSNATYDLSSLASSTNIKFSFVTYIQTGGHMLLDSVRIGDAATLFVAQNELIDDVKLYPNPAQDMVYVEMNTTEPASIIVYDVSGRQMVEISYTVQGKRLAITTSMLSNGIYYLHIEQAGVVVVKQFSIYK